MEGNCIRVGLCTYRTVVLPDCETISSHTASLLRAFVRNGGRLYIYGNAPTRVDGEKAELSFLRSNLTAQELRDSCGILVQREGRDVPLHMHVRCTRAGRMIFLANTSAEGYDNVTVNVKNARGFSCLHPGDLTLHPVRGRREKDGSVTVLYDFGDSVSCLLVETGAEMEPFVKTAEPAYIRLQEPFVPTALPENMLLLDTASISLDGGAFTEERPIARIRDELLSARFCGQVTLRFRFRTEFVSKSLLLSVEPMKGLAVFVNGDPAALCPGYRLDCRNLLADLGSHVRTGENEVLLSFPYFQREHVYRVLFGAGTESLRNCLSFDTEVEPVYLFGDFDVRSLTPFRDDVRNTLRTDGGFVLTPRDPRPDFRDLVRSGYPFFAGEITGRSTLHYRPGDPTCFRPGGRFAVCRLQVNGKTLPTDLFAESFELAPYLREGENELVLTLCLSNRNLMGPHHRRDPEPPTVGPRTMTFEKQWRDGQCPEYQPSYAFVRLGIGF